MSEQLFKAYDLDKKEWVEDFYINEDGDIFTIDFDDFGPTHEYVRSATLVRATGLRDNKRTQEYPDGQMIFEGDIVLFHIDGDSKKPKEFGEITYSDRRACFKINPKGEHFTVPLFASIPISMGIVDPDTNIEIIGNKWDNPELLEVEK